MDAQAVAEKVRDVMLADDAASRMLGIQITEVAAGRAVVTMTVRAPGTTARTSERRSAVRAMYAMSPAYP